jgi:X-X-X-Leu-X-X-Gly heptad repeat protein
MAAQVNLKVNSNFEQASNDLKKYGKVTEAEAKRIKKFTESFKTAQIDKFIEKNKRTAAAIKATKGPIDAVQAEYKALQRQIQSLITKGLDPQDKSLLRLKNRYNQLQVEMDQTNNKQQKSSNLLTTANAAYLAVGASVVLYTRRVITNTIAVAKQGDELAKTSAIIGISAEQLQELTFAADRSGVSSEELTGGLQKLNKNIGDLRAGTGPLNTILKENNSILLENLKGAEDNEEAFTLLLDAINRSPSEFDKAAIAQAAFGRAGQSLINVAALGAEGLQELREEARSYGLITNEAAAESEEFVDAMTNLKAATEGMKNEIVTGYIPALTDVLSKVTEIIVKERELKKIRDTQKGIFTGEIEAQGQSLEILREALTKNKEAQVALNAVGDPALELYDREQMIIAEIVKLQKDLLVVKKEVSSETVKDSKATLANVEAAKAAALERAKFIQEQANAGFSTKLALFEKEKALQDKFTAELLESEKISLTEKLSVLNNMEAMAEQERLVTFTDFLTARTEQEQLSGEEKILFLEENLARVKDLEMLSNAERLSATKAVEKAITTEKKKQLTARISLMQAELKAVNTLIGGMLDLANVFAGENRKAAEAAKALAHAQAGINTFLAATQALADPRLPFWAKGAAVAGVIASGTASQIKIAQTPIPTAQTGTPAGGITIPNDTSARGDNVAVMAAPGENVQVTPRGEGAGMTQNISVELNGETLIEFMNEKIESGDIRITTDNIQDGITA